MKCTVEIKRLRVHAPVGVYDFEKTGGNDLEVTARLVLDVETALLESDELSATIDYSIVVDIVKRTLLQGFNLLETAALTIAKELKSLSTGQCQVAEVTVKIAKLNPPIADAPMEHASALITL